MREKPEMWQRTPALELQAFDKEPYLPLFLRSGYLQDLCSFHLYLDGFQQSPHTAKKTALKIERKQQKECQNNRILMTS